jgi:hypothetical protein
VVKSLIQFNCTKNIFVCINQKKFNTKSTVFSTRTLNTFSVGSIIRYFNLKQGKSSRRSIKGIKIFLNFIKNILEKKYSKGSYLNNKFIFQINGFDYNLLFLKKFFFKIIQQKYFYSLYKLILFNIKVCFTKKKLPKKKSIKKRITKNIFINFNKNNKKIIFN